MIDIQKKYQHLLRKEAIEHLAYSQQISARSFRQEYLAAGLGSYQPFLNAQSKNGAWGTYLEAIALSEKYGVNLVVTPVSYGVKQNPICLYRADSPNAKTVHLYNSNNTHWYVDSKTLGDGNCLYNAFSQALYKLSMIISNSADSTEKSFSKKLIDKPLSKLSFFHHTHDKEVRNSQEAILAAIRKAPTSAEKEQDFEQERKRISHLSPEEQKQIADDHAYALRLARENEGEIRAFSADSSLSLK